MSVARPLPATLALLLFASACATSATDTSSPDSPLWRVSMSVSGGLRGIVQSFEVTDSGWFSAMDRRQRITRTGRLSETKRERVATLLAELDTDRASARGGVISRCADCVHYDLQLAVADARTVVRLDSLNVGQSSYAALVKVLVSELRKALQ